MVTCTITLHFLVDDILMAPFFALTGREVREAVVPMFGAAAISIVVGRVFRAKAPQPAEATS